MSTAWTLTASEICTDALRNLGVLGEGEAASGDEMQTALRGLDVVLKELPLSGYTWPKLSAETALTWVSGQTIALPADYYGSPVVWKTVNSQKTPLTPIPHANWVTMVGREQTGTVTHYYVNPANVLYLWPIPTVDPVVSIQYQRIVDDASFAVTADVLQSMKGALSYGVADEISMKSGVPQAVRVEVSQRWSAKRALMLQNAVPNEPISFEVLG